MLTLHELQNCFRQSVTGDPSSELIQLIAADGFEPAARLSVYRNNLATRLTDTLTAAYPVVRRLVGPEFFAYACDLFLRRHLPVSGYLCDYGEELSAFLADFPPSADLKYLADVARLEWAIHKACHAALLPPAAITALTAMIGDACLLKLRLAPAVQFTASPYPVDRIWIAHQTDSGWGDVGVGENGAWLQINGTKGLRITNLSPVTWEFRVRLAAAETLGSAVTRALAMASDFCLVSELTALFADGLVVGLT